MRIILLLIFLSFATIGYCYDWTQDANCVGAWLLEEGTGTTTDDASSEENDGTFAASAPAWYNSSTPASWSDWAIDFDDTTDKIAFGDVDILNSETASTITAWINLDATSGVGRIVHKWGSGSTNYQDYVLTTDGDEIAYANQASSNYTVMTTSSANLGTGSWIHVAATWTAQETVVIYIDGVSKSLTDSGDGISAIQNGTLELHFGYESTEPQNAFNGKLDEVAIFDDVKDSTDVNDIMDNGLLQATARRIFITKLMSNRKEVD